MCGSIPLPPADPTATADTKRRKINIRIIASKRKPYVVRREERIKKRKILENEIKEKECKWWKRRKDREEIQKLQEKLQKIIEEEKEDQTNASLEVKWQEQERKIEELKASIEKRKKKIEKIRHSDEWL